MTTFYEDWSAARGQTSENTLAILRDLLSWATYPDPMDNFTIGEPINLQIPVTNHTDHDLDHVRVRLIAPNRTVAKEVMIPVSLSPDASTTLATRRRDPATSPLVPWRLSEVSDTSTLFDIVL